MKNKLNAVVIGLGIGMAHVAGYLESEEAQLYGVCDLDKARLEKIGGTFAEGSMLCLKNLIKQELLEKEWNDIGAKVFTSYEDVLEDDNVDIISICTPDYLHASHIEAAMKKHKHIILEKPVAISLEDANRLKPTAMSYDKFLAVAYEFRSIPPINDMKTAVINGELGDVLAFSLYHYRTPFRRDKWNKWIQRKEYSGGLLVEETCHWFDLARYLTGKEVESVSAVYQQNFHPDFDFEDIAYVNGIYEDGSIMQISHALTGYDFSLVITLHGTKKVMTCAFKETERSSLDGYETDYYAILSEGPMGGRLEDATIKKYGIEATEPDAIKSEVIDCVHRIASKQEPVADFDDGLKSLQIAIAAGTAARENRIVTL